MRIVGSLFWRCSYEGEPCWAHFLLVRMIFPLEQGSTDGIVDYDFKCSNVHIPINSRFVGLFCLHRANGLSDVPRSYKVGFNFYSVGGALFMALEGPEEREICEQMREEIKERLQEQFFLCKSPSSVSSAPRNNS